MDNITYREARHADWQNIAYLHCRSWQENYRGTLTNDYLDNHCLPDRLQIWEKRFSRIIDNQYIIIAENQKEMCGFACTYGNHDEQFGSLLDNLHVSKAYRGLRLGENLLSQSAQWSFQHYPECEFYLWVLVKNKKATKFYKRVGALTSELTYTENPDGGTAAVYRCSWPTLSTVLLSESE